MKAQSCVFTTLFETFEKGFYVFIQLIFIHHVVLCNNYMRYAISVPYVVL